MGNRGPSLLASASASAPTTSPRASHASGDAHGTVALLTLLRRVAIGAAVAGVLGVLWALKAHAGAVLTLLATQVHSAGAWGVAGYVAAFAAWGVLCLPLSPFELLSGFATPALGRTLALAPPSPPPHPRLRVLALALAPALLPSPGQASSSRFGRRWPCASSARPAQPACASSSGAPSARVPPLTPHTTGDFGQANKRDHPRPRPCPCPRPRPCQGSSLLGTHLIYPSETLARTASTHTWARTMHNAQCTCTCTCPSAEQGGIAGRALGTCSTRAHCALTLALTLTLTSPAARVRTVP